MQANGISANGQPCSTVLVLVQEPVVRDIIAAHLRHAGFYPVPADSLEAALRLIAELLPDAAVLDVDAPEVGGLALLRELRAAEGGAGVAVMCLASALVRCRDGAQSTRAQMCVGKPFSPKALVARLSQLLDVHAPVRPGVLQIGPLELDPADHTIRVHGSAGAESLRFPGAEFRLLQYLMSTPDRVHSRDQLVAKVWHGHEPIHPRTVDQNIKRLRTSLGGVGLGALIETVRGVGYRLRAPSP